MLSRRVFQNLMSGQAKSKAQIASTALHSSALLSGLTDEQIDLVASELEQLELEGGEVIGYEGKLAEAFYVIQRGSVVLTRERYVDGDEFDEEVGRLSGPVCFGEHALDWVPKHERKRGSLAYPDEKGDGEQGGDRPKMLRLASGACIASPGLASTKKKAKDEDGGKGGSKGAAHAKKTEAPPIWRDTIMADPEEKTITLLWMSRDHFAEVCMQGTASKQASAAAHTALTHSPLLPLPLPPFHSGCRPPTRGAA